MAKTAARPSLHVEGIDDAHSIKQLLIRNGLVYPPGPSFVNAPPGYPEISDAKGVENLIERITANVKSSTDRPVGFVFDADAPLIDRWRQVHGRLAREGVDAPADRPPAEGFIGVSATYLTRVGVWVMPDNERDGKLENFLVDLIAEGNSLIAHAQKATAEARALGATFSEPDTIKAEIHAWLAWQDEPGKPYGQAIMAKYFRHDSPVAARFVAWFRDLYGLAEPTA